MATDAVVIAEINEDEIEKERRRIEEERIMKAREEAETFEK